MPLPYSPDALTARKAKFTLAADGELQGTVTGLAWRARGIVAAHAAAQRGRADAARVPGTGPERNACRPGRGQAGSGSPTGRRVDGALQVEYQVTLPQWAVVSGNRMLLGMGMFGGQEQGVFVAATRVHPVYYRYPFSNEDEVQVALPAGFHLQGAPDAWPAATGGRAGLRREGRGEWRDAGDPPRAHGGSAAVEEGNLSALPGVSTRRCAPAIAQQLVLVR